MKKIIIVRIREMVMGGISKTAVDLLKNLDNKKYKIVFFIERDLEENNCFLDEIPKEIDIYFLKNYESIKKIEEVSLKKKKIFFNIKYNLLREYNRYISNKKFLNFLKKNEEIKAIIDFDMGLAKNIKQYKKYKTIAWIHNSILDWGKTQKRIDSTKKYYLTIRKLFVFVLK
ncbi:glycosyltransferase family protein [Fusobacterium ulcerans]